MGGGAHPVRDAEPDYEKRLAELDKRIAELEDALRDLVDRRYLECVTEMPCGDCACCRAKAVLKAAKP